MSIQMTKEQYDEILTHARNGLPYEACGLLAGVAEGEVKIVKKVYLLQNIDKSREHFTMDQKEQLQAVKDMRSLHYEQLGNFHSHPETPSRPSEEDIRLAYDSKASYLILSLQEENQPVLKAFQIKDKNVSEEEIKVTE